MGDPSMFVESNCPSNRSLCNFVVFSNVLIIPNSSTCFSTAWSWHFRVQLDFQQLPLALHRPWHDKGSRRRGEREREREREREKEKERERDNERYRTNQMKLKEEQQQLLTAEVQFQS